MSYRSFLNIFILCLVILCGLVACSSCAHATIFEVAQAQSLTDRTASGSSTVPQTSGEAVSETNVENETVVIDTPSPDVYVPEKPNVNEKLFFMQGTPKDIGALLEGMLTQTKDQLLPYIALHTSNQSYVGQLLQIQGQYALIRVPGNADGAYNAQPYSGTSQIDTYDYIDLNQVEGFSLETRSR